MAELERKLGLTGLMATGICAMLGASIYIVPFMVHRSVPALGPYVLPAFLIAAIPAVLAAMAYASLASAMPRAGGSYLYASRGLSPYLGFIASFSQWFGLSIVIGVIAYVIVPFLRDIASALQWTETITALETGWVRVSLALAMIWLFVGINIRGLKSYTAILVPMMVLMFALGGIVIIAGLVLDHADFTRRLLELESGSVPIDSSYAWDWVSILSASALLFSSFIGFDSVAQAGSEASNPRRNLPLAILLTIGVVAAFYFLFTLAVYHAVPWSFVAAEAAAKDISAAGLMAYLLPPGLAVAILAGAAIALINDLPAMLLAVSRLVYAWADDGIFPTALAEVHRRFHTPHRALIMSGIIASIGILGSHFAGDFFLGIDIMVTAMMVNFLLMCLTLMWLPFKNPELAAKVATLRKPISRYLVAGAGALMLIGFLVMHVWKDLSANVSAWYFHSTWVWLLVMILGSLVFLVQRHRLLRAGVDLNHRFSHLPD